MTDQFDSSSIARFNFHALLCIYRSSLAVALLLLTSISIASEDYVLTAPPTWVTDTQYDKNAGSINDSVDGQYDHLYERQINLRDKLKGPQAFTRSATKLLNTTGVERGSVINISFDPTYQSVHLHNIQVVRGEQIIDKLDSASIQLLRRELDADSLIYDGRRTLNIILEDMRVGDVLEYSYSRLGANPVYDGLTELTAETNWQVPVGKLSMRILASVNEPLTIKSNNTDIEVTTTEHNDHLEYSFQDNQIEPVFKDDDTPRWVDRWGYISFTETPNWSDIVDWAGPLFNDAIGSDSRIDTIAQSIATKHSDIPDQIGAALHWVQDEIRYLGIEFGTNSHRPSSPTEVLDRRFGDCKDKSVLLISLLRALGIESNVALANTRRTHGLPGHTARRNAFNHSLVHLNYNGESHWLDPTYTYQRGRLGDFFEPDYGYALLLNNTSTDLVRMVPKPIVTSKIINKTFNLSEIDDQPSSMTVHTIATGLDGERAREKRNTDGESSTIRNYEKYYTRYYKNTHMQGGIEFTDHPDNSVESIETYHLPNLWRKDDDSINYTWVYADEIYDYLDLPKTLTNRTYPYQISHPTNIQENLTISTAFKLDNNSEYFREDNKYFTFTREMSTNTETNQLLLKFSYTTKTDHVIVEDLQKFSDDAAKVEDYLSFFIEGNKRESASPFAVVDRSENQFNYFIGFVAVLGLLFLYAVIEWLTERYRHNEIPVGVFYPVSIPKFIVMGTLTLSVYLIYWFYRNFHYMRDTLKRKLVPGIRAFFSILFLYSLIKAVNEETEKTTGKKSLSSWLSIFIATTYFILILIVNSEQLPMGLFILPVLLLIPLVLSIKRLNQNDKTALAYNSRFRFRHLALLLCIPLATAWVMAMDSGLISSDEVLDGDDLWQFQKSHLVENKLVPEDENVQMFFSDALLDVRNDGTGFTKKRLFSYWIDDLGNLQWRNVPFEDIVSISMNEKAPDEYIKLTVNLQDDSSWEFQAPGRDSGGAKFTFRLQALIASWHS